MNFLDTVRSSLDALGANRLRSFLTLLGIIVGVAAVVCMVSVGLGAQAEVAEKIRTLGANLIVVRPGAQVRGGARLDAGTQHTLTEEDAAALERELPAIRIAAPLISRSAQLVVGNRNWSTLAAGVTSGYLVAREWQIERGRSFAASELTSAAKVAIIGAVVDEELFAGQAALGDTLR